MSQDERSWLKDDALRNMLAMTATFEVSQDEMSWLNDTDSKNIKFIDVALETFHDPMLSLEEWRPWKTRQKSWTLETFHLPIGHPYVVAKYSASLGLYCTLLSNGDSKLRPRFKRLWRVCLVFNRGGEQGSSRVAYYLLLYQGRYIQESCDMTIHIVR